MSWDRKTVHYRGDRADSAPCGYVFDKRVHGADYSATWVETTPYPVTCLNCLLKRPAKRKWKTWLDGNGKQRR